MSTVTSVSDAIVSDVNRVVAALLALLPGGLGIHRLSCNRTGRGIVSLLLVRTVIPARIARSGASSYLVKDDAKSARARRPSSPSQPPGSHHPVASCPVRSTQHRPTGEAVARDRRRKSFAEIVREERARPPRPDRTRVPPGRHDDLLVLDGRRYTLITEPLEAARARTLVRDGAQLAFDPCGCGGRCGIQILHEHALAGSRQHGNPTIGQGPNHPGSLSSWAAVEPPETTLVLASGHVIWGRALA